MTAISGGCSPVQFSSTNTNTRSCHVRKFDTVQRLQLLRHRDTFTRSRVSKEETMNQNHCCFTTMSLFWQIRFVFILFTITYIFVFANLRTFSNVHHKFFSSPWRHLQISGCVQQSIIQTAEKSQKGQSCNLVSGAFMEMLDLLDVTLHLTPLVFFGISSTELHVNRRSNQVISQTSCSFIDLWEDVQ